MMVRTKRMLNWFVGAVAAVLMLTATAPAQNAPGTARALAMLPPNSDAVLAVSFSATTNPNSIASYLPWDQVQLMIQKEIEKSGTQPVDGSTEAVLRTAFLDGLTGKVEAMAISYQIDMTSGDVQDHAVLLGSFKQAEVGPLLRKLNIQPGPKPTVAKLDGAMGKTYYLGLPADGCIFISRNQQWVNDALQIGTDKSGLTGSGTPFMQSYQAVGGQLPDVMVYISGKTIKDIGRMSPQAPTLAGPLLQATGMMINLNPGTPPAAEIVATYDNAQQASIAQQWLQSMVQMAKGYAQSAIMNQQQNPQDPQAQQQTQKQIQNLDEAVRNINISASGKAAKLTYTMNGLPSREEAKQKIAETLKEAEQTGSFESMINQGMLGGGI